MSIEYRGGVAIGKIITEDMLNKAYTKENVIKLISILDNYDYNDDYDYNGDELLDFLYEEDIFFCLDVMFGGSDYILGIGYEIEEGCASIVKDMEIHPEVYQLIKRIWVEIFGGNENDELDTLCYCRVY